MQPARLAQWTQRLCLNPCVILSQVIRFHDLRHTFASHLVMKGVDLRTVAKLMGHKDIKMTMRYAHLAPEHLQAAVDALTVATVRQDAERNVAPQ